MEGEYWLNDLYNGTNSQISGSDLDSLTIILPAYGTAIYTISDKEESVDIPNLPDIVSVQEKGKSIPSRFSLYQNYPNPFNPSTTIRFSIPMDLGKKTVLVELDVYDVLGRDIKTLVNSELSAGNYEIQFNASDLASGIYFYTLKVGEFLETRKMILLK